MNEEKSFIKLNKDNRKTIDNVGTRILRWDEKDRTYYGLENQGKEITDHNPYIKVDGDVFHESVQSYPLVFEQGPVYNKLDLMKVSLTAPKSYRNAIRTDMSRVKKGAKKSNQLKKHNDKITEKPYTSIEEKLQLKKEILDFLKVRNLIGGFTLIDRRYINLDHEDKYPYNTLLMVGMEMEMDTIMEIPNTSETTGKVFDIYIYGMGGLMVNEITEFIQSKGVKCLAHPPLSEGSLNFPPHAINAGLGNYSTHGLMMTKEWGTRQRLFAISMDVDIPIDEPKNYNFEEFCARCRMCYKTCLASAIPRDEAEYYGQTKRALNRKQCGATMYENKSCGHCLKVCPVNNFGYNACIETIPKYYDYNLDEATKNILKRKLEEGELNA